MKMKDCMSKYIFDTKGLFWYQRLKLFLSYYVYDFKRMMIRNEILVYKNEILVYKDKNIQQYMLVKGRNVILHTRERNGNKIFKRYNDKYFIA